MAKSPRLDATGASTTVAVGLGQRSDGGYGLDLDIKAHLPGLFDDDARKLVEAMHQVCPYSDSTRGNIDVRLHVDTNA